MNIRTVDQSLFSKPSHTKTRTRICEEASCSNTTRENKPFCSNHVERADYVQDILHAIKNQEIEQEKALSQGIRAIKRDSLTVKEIILTLSQKGEKTINYLCRDLQLPEDVMLVYAKFLVKHKIAKRHRTHRGSETLVLR